MAQKNGRCRGVYEKVKGSNDWWIRYVDQDGKLHRERVGAKKLAIDLYRKRKTEIREGKFFATQIGRQRVVLFKELAEDFLEYSRANKRSCKADECRVKPLLKAFGGRPASAITPEEIEKFKAAQMKRTYIKGGTTRRLAIATVKQHVDLLRAIFNRGIKNKKVETNPMLEVENIKLNNERVRYFIGDEQSRMFAKLPTKYHDLIKLALLSGLRASNLRHLEWSRIDLDAGVYTIPHTKNGKSLRLPLHEDAKRLLASLPRNGSRYVFPGHNGGPLSSEVQKTFAKAIRQAGINDFHFHDLRHTFASSLAMKGCSLQEIMELGGWKTLGMVLRYAHLSPRHLRDALNQLPSITTDTSARTTPIPATETNPIEPRKSSTTEGSASTADPS